ncbi:YeeE/YedE family protein [Acetomicrobium mobile]|uniref:YeeE/YedE family protein n=1 Tax=Acetomicrobium mobile TaxID=97477 RepID=UPI0026F0B981|nr:YeeE/YedE family protein [Acetomicrobium mobile]
MKKVEYAAGFLVILCVVIGGKIFLGSSDLYFRLLIGAGLGYTLSRAYTGFAGSVYRAYKTGSTRLMRTMTLMFLITAFLTAAFLFGSDPASYNLWINPINLGLIIGAFLFGFGMSLSECCATGVLTIFPSALPKAFITLFFFGLGVFLGFPIQRTASWVNDSWFSTEVGLKLAGGVFLPDLFKGDGFGGYLGAILITTLFSGIVVYACYTYEKHRIETNTYTGHPLEIMQEQLKPMNAKTFKLFSAQTYEHIFVKPWTLREGAVGLALLFMFLMGVTKAGWGASTPFGIWVGKLFMLFGMSPESIANFTHMSADTFTLPFFRHGASVQNFGILVGAFIYLLTAGQFVQAFKSGLRMRKKEAAVFALGGICMGLGTRLANGCNVGALYSPIANLSLSGWIFLVFMVAGGILSCKIRSKITE